MRESAEHGVEALALLRFHAVDLRRTQRALRKRRRKEWPHKAQKAQEIGYGIL